MIKDESGNRRFIGVYRAIVVDNNDPLGKNRLRLQIPQVLLGEETGWAWGIFPATSSNLPNIGDGVWVSFEGGDPSHPVWTGVFTDSANLPASYEPNWAGTGLAYTGVPAVGEYIKTGKLIFFNIKVNFTNVTNFGTGQYHLTLPFAANSDYVFRNGGIHQGGTHYNFAADAAANSVNLNLYHMQSTNGSNSYVYDDPFTGSNPVNLTTSGYMYVSGTYIAA
jgi:Type VI secretion system/phage-baseplate injector OB domain